MLAFARDPLIYGMWVVGCGLWTVEWGPDGSVERWGGSRWGGRNEEKEEREGMAIPPGGQRSQWKNGFPRQVRTMEGSRRPLSRTIRGYGWPTWHE